MRRFAVPVLALSALCTSALAQTATTSLRGVVQDSSGAVIPGAVITLSNAESGQKITQTANDHGEYQLPQIAPARYTITVTAPGFGTQTKQAELLVNQPATIGFTLGVQSTTEVDVTESAQTLNNTDATLGNAFDNATIQNLPSETRNVPDLLSLQPGVFYVQPPLNTATEDSRVGAVNGERSDQSNVTLDGVDDNDQLRGLAFFGVLRETQDSVDEFRVVTSNANADEGRSAGAQVSLVTKSGTNKFHGAAYEYFRPTNTVSNNYFVKQAELESGEANRPPKLIRNIFGGDFGGFIIKDKLFFFGNYEGQRLAEDQSVSRTVPTASYQAGNLQYLSNNNPVTLTPAQVTALDAGCTVCNTAAYAPGPGADPFALAYLRSYPAANGTSLGDGLNSGSYNFSSPAPDTLNTSIVRLDYAPSNKHRIFGRFGLQKDTLADVEQFPGQPPRDVLIDNSKGMIFGDTWTISPHLVNDIRYGYIRQGYGQSGVGTGDYVDFRFLDTPTAETRTTDVNLPVNNIVDNFTISSGKHTFGLGGNWRLLHINRSSNNTTFNGGSTNPYWLGGNPPDPNALLGAPAVDSGFNNSFEIAYSELVGNVPEVTNSYNYQVTSPTTGNLLPDGAFLTRHFKANEFEYYLQDSWQVHPKLTLTFGIRHSLLQTPYETSGQEVAPTISTHDWYLERETAAEHGEVYEPDLQFAPTGPYYGKPGFYPKSKNNIAPRLAFAYAPDPKTSIRAGFGLYYDHFGESLINTFDQNGSFGISSSVSNPSGQYTSENSPRFTGRNTLPFSNGTATSSITYPYTAPTGNFAITWGLDDKIKTPYTESIDFSVQHQLPAGITLETAYVGRLGRHLLQQLDLAEPVNFNDPGGGGDYYTAGAKLSAAVDANAGHTNATVSPIPYFEHLFPFMANRQFIDGNGNLVYDGTGKSATQNIYTLEWAPYRQNLGATTALADLDFACGDYGVTYCPAGYQSKFYQDQFSSLYALSSIGMSYYNALQVSLRHPMTHGVQFDFNYTYSKSIDYGSDAERATEDSGVNTTGISTASSAIINTWRPYLNKAVSDFDTHHIVTVDTVMLLPVGRGRHYLNQTNHLVDAFVGGWQFAGIFRTTSGLPFSLNEPGWTTDYQQEGYGIVTGNLKAKKTFSALGNVDYFANPTAINNGVSTGSPVRLPYPGETGERNFFRGDGFLELDPSLSKSWKLAEYGAIKFDWAVYNATNTNRFDPSTGIGSTNGELTSGTLGQSSVLLGGSAAPRRMQFALRYDF